MSIERPTLSLIMGPTQVVFVFFLISLNSFSLFDILLAFFVIYYDVFECGFLL